MSPITTHVLDTARGCPAEGLKITLEKQTDSEQWELLAEGLTNADGRLPNLISESDPFTAGIYRMVFYTGPYQQKWKSPSFYPEVPVIFEIIDPSQHYHVPLLLSPFGFSTYRGS